MQTTMLESRRSHMFPVLAGPLIRTARRFASGPEKAFAPGEWIYAIGESDAPSWLVIEGSIDVVRRDGLNAESAVVTYHVGQFSGDVNQLAGRPSIAGGRAGVEGCTAVPFDALHLRSLMVGSAELGELMMRAFILRRVELIEDGGAGTILIGDPRSAEVIRLHGFLTRSGYPNRVLDAATDAEGRALVVRLGVLPDELPLVVCPNGNLLKNPSDADVASCLGIMPAIDMDMTYDVAVVGAGPAGLATAVYAASEGLSVIVLDGSAMGGQAGASARIENYLGFPTGISGQELAARAFHQAIKFGAEVAVPLTVARLDCSSEPLQLQFAAGGALKANTVVIATGARYRRPDIEGLDGFEGTAVSYWASPIEARLCAGQTVGLVGGGNSAGQAIVFLASYVTRMHVFVRRDLSETMSRYLIDRIAVLPNVDVHVGSQIVGLNGDGAGGLESAAVHSMSNGLSQAFALRHLFLFIGAEPNADWLDGCVETDKDGFVQTGLNALPHETSRPGVFAIGDIRSGSTKRVAAAVGEGAAVIAEVHAMQARQKPVNR
jgi:thioredoxin reductase (NADPH)